VTLLTPFVGGGYPAIPHLSPVGLQPSAMRLTPAPPCWDPDHRDPVEVIM